MGFNATVVVLLDQLESIRNDASFGEKLAQAVLHKANRPNEDHSYITGQVQVIEVHHADSQMVVAVGGNTGKVLGYGGSYRSTPDEMIKWLNQDRLRRKREAAKL
ncbi:MAG: hypothetical protein WC100_20215 [Sterolibacterium sp.]